jgi:hypothetical protein
MRDTDGETDDANSEYQAGQRHHTKRGPVSRPAADGEAGAREAEV